MIFCAINAWADGDASDIYLPYDSVELIYNNRKETIVEKELQSHILMFILYHKMNIIVF